MRPTELTDLDRVTATIVNRKSGIGLFHYNKLTYLVEFLFIKNFGKRLSGEKFIKYPHGPVIVDYHKQIEKLHNRSIVTVDLKELRTKRSFEEGERAKVSIQKTETTKKYLYPTSMVQDFIYGVVDKYGEYPADELEKIVYSTAPVINYKNSIFKRVTGGYILTGDCIRMKDYKSPITEGRKKALEHLKKYPTVNWKQQKKLIKEFAPLESLRPQHES
jgi:uncharacterized phage-associated protein